MNAVYHRFQYLCDRELAEVRTRCESMLGNWVEEWAPCSEYSVVSVTNLEVAVDCSGDVVCLADDGACVRLESPLSLAAVLIAQPDTSLLSDDEVTRSLLQEAASSLLKSFLIDAGKMTWRTGASGLRAFPGGGYLNVAMSIRGNIINVLAPIARFPGSPDRREPIRNTVLAPRIDAIRKASLNLSAMLGEVDLTIGELNSLQPGDVVSFSVPTSSLLSLVNDDSREVCRGVLGEYDGHRALSIVKCAQ